MDLEIRMNNAGHLVPALVLCILGGQVGALVDGDDERVLLEAVLDGEEESAQLPLPTLRPLHHHLSLLPLHQLRLVIPLLFIVVCLNKHKTNQTK